MKSISIEQLLQQSITLNVNPVGFDYNLGSKEKTRKKKTVKNLADVQNDLQKHILG